MIKKEDLLDINKGFLFGDIVRIYAEIYFYVPLDVDEHDINKKSCWKFWRCNVFCKRNTIFHTQDDTFI